MRSPVLTYLVAVVLAAVGAAGMVAQAERRKGRVTNRRIGHSAAQGRRTV